MTMSPPPKSEVVAVTDFLHGVAVTDPYRWLEDQDSVQTRAWLQTQADYARSYLHSIPGRDRIRQRVQEFLAIDSYDSLLISGNRYFFRKRFPDREQACICIRVEAEGADLLLLDPSDFGLGKFISVRPLRVSSDGRLLLYEMKRGGERKATFELLDVESRRALPDRLPLGHLRGFAFSSDSNRFYYVHEHGKENGSQCRAYRHVLGTSIDDDQEVFSACDSAAARVQIVPGKHKLGFLVHHFLDKTYTDFYLWAPHDDASPELWLEHVDYKIAPLLHDNGRVLAITDYDAPNFRIVEINQAGDLKPHFTDVIPESDSPIQGWIVTKHLIAVSYLKESQTRVEIFDLQGRRVRALPIEEGDTIRLAAASLDNDEFFIERESFTKPIQIYRYSSVYAEPRLWANRQVPINSAAYRHTQVWFTAKDGKQIPMFLVGRRDVLDNGARPTIMTSYGGYGLSMTPQFSVFVTYLMERGCLFALPSIRGGLEFGVEWHLAAKRRNRQVAFDDFICAAESLIATGRTGQGKLAIFGGSNSGLLVGAAMTQRPELFRAVVCMVPLLDMLRYHLFDGAHVWKDELGTSEDPNDFAALASYSPYHHVREGAAYPATMIISGDADQNCNPMHARKMTARLQAANTSEHPIFLDYTLFRGHSPVLPLSERIEALTDRLAFVCDQLGLGF